MSETFYITCAIDYPNSIPHMGHAYEKTVADFYARYYRLMGRDTRFLIGLDEHGQKIQEVAAREDVSPQDFVDKKAEAFHSLYDLLRITRDDFIRTSEKRHVEYAQSIYKKVLANGDIYKDFYEADYCISCEKALTKSELVDGKCPVHDRPTTQIKEASYFFKLSKYRDQMREHIEANPSFVVTAQRRNEVLARLRDEVYDLSISRSTFDWGVPVPDDPDHVLYVWFDALLNYTSALESPENLHDRYWPASCQVIGKDILWFHAFIWPAILLSAGIELPKQIFVHGFILDKDGRKMAKTLGNVIDPREVAEDIGVDVLRYYFVRGFASGQDGKFSVKELEDRYQGELANDLGNLIMRVAKLATTRIEGGVVEPPAEGASSELSSEALAHEFGELTEARDHNRAIDALWVQIRKTNSFLNDRAPWKLKEADEVRAVIYPALDSLRAILHYLSPVMPATAARAADSLGFDIGPFSTIEEGKFTYRVRMETALFPRRESKEKPAEDAGGSAKKSKPQKKGQVEVDPFAKLELRVAHIDEVVPHPDADSLYHMTVDIGGEKRSICAGLREHLAEEELRGRKVLVLANLKPAKLRGIESRGMILASDRKDGKVVPVEVGDAASGDRIHVDGIEPRPKKKLSKSDFEKAPLLIQAGRVTYAGKPLLSPQGEILCDSDDGAPVR